MQVFSNLQNNTQWLKLVNHSNETNGVVDQIDTDYGEIRNLEDKILINGNVAVATAKL